MISLPEKETGATKIKPADSPAAGEAEENESSQALREDKVKSPQAGGEQFSPSAIKLDGDGEKADAGDDEVTGRDRKEFFANIVIGVEDVGKTLLKKIDEASVSADVTTELSPTEQKYLDNIIFRGYCSHTIFLKEDFPVTFRSTAPRIVQKGYGRLASYKGLKQKLGSLETCMLLAVYLESYGESPKDGLFLSHQSMTIEEFGSDEALEERFKFTNTQLSSLVVDALYKRLGEFLNLLSRISLSKNIVNF